MVSPLREREREREGRNHNKSSTHSQLNHMERSFGLLLTGRLQTSGKNTSVLGILTQHYTHIEHTIIEVTVVVVHWDTFFECNIMLNFVNNCLQIFYNKCTQIFFKPHFTWNSHWFQLLFTPAFIMQLHQLHHCFTSKFISQFHTTFCTIFTTHSQTPTNSNSDG